MPIKKIVHDEILYFVDTETGEIKQLMPFNDFCAASIAHDLTGDAIKVGSGQLKLGDSDEFTLSIYYDHNFSARVTYLMCLKAGVDIFFVPNNFRRMHGYKVRRRSLRKRRAMQKLKLPWKR